MGGSSYKSDLEIVFGNENKIVIHNQMGRDDLADLCINLRTVLN
jgi:hypothetical protein